MKQLLTGFLTLVIGVFVQAQVSIQTKIPPIVPGSEITIEIKINKGAISNFAKFQIDVPEGAYLSEGDNKTGSFSFEKNRAKIIWVNIPTEAEFVVTMKLNPGTATGMGTINQKFYYLDNGVRKEVEAMPLNLNFSGNTAVISTSQAAPEAGPENTATAPATENPPANTPVAPETAEPAGSSNTIVERAPANTSEEPVPAAPSKESTAESIRKLKEQFDAANKSAPDDEPVLTVPEKAPASKAVAVAPTPAAAVPGLVYKIQIGAYGENPGMSKYRALKEVKIITENNFYKVLVGNFKTREEATKRKEELLAKGFRGFLVMYQNGQRVK